MLEAIIVDPEYRNRGFGTRLCIDRLMIAMYDRVPVGAVATDEGSKLYRSLGFRTRERLPIVDPAPWKEATLEYWAIT
jgi:ribosomal protein S18 acetylase RimI-like enzyme